MLTGATFNFKNQKTAMVPEYGHNAVGEDRNELYRLMYMKLSARWIRDKIHLHIIGHFAHDNELTDTLFQLGFGAILSERLRDLSPVTHDHKFRIQYVHDLAKLVELAQEHRQYYLEAPIFIKKNPEPEAILSDLKDHVEHGDRFLVYYEQDVPAGYLTIGALKKKGEGFLLRDTNTAQVKSAFIKPFFRGKGAGAALLDEAIAWARDDGFDRLFVEHETANYYDGQFWQKYFSFFARNRLSADT
jgi:GNAT superfamily N-acetyltransferase